MRGEDMQDLQDEEREKANPWPCASGLLFLFFLYPAHLAYPPLSCIHFALQ